MKKLLFIIFIGAFAGCKQTRILTKHKQIKKHPSISIIPKPVSVKRKSGNFRLTRNTTIQIPPDSPKSRYAGAYLKKKLHASTAYHILMDTTAFPADSSRIILSLISDTTGFGNNEGYSLRVSPREIHIISPTPHGLFNGVQSLIQLFPPQIEQTDYTLVPQSVQWTAPAVEIKDYPRFAYRGLHLDVSRHFFGVNFIKRYIDLMAKYKLNRFHWHLTDDQGWRIQIKQYPKLTTVGAWRDSTVVGRYNSGIYNHRRTGGFYTQKQIRDIVAYAQKRFITIIPEIEMPGHSGAALAAYPWLGCQQITNYHVWATWGSDENSVYCPHEKTFNFLENVLTEVMQLFPSQYIHIGGDEVTKTAWQNSRFTQRFMKQKGLKDEEQLQSYFIRRIEKFLNNHDRNIIGWDEILEGGLAPKATVESWRGVKGGIKAAQKHHDVIMAPSSFYYLNYYQAQPKTEPIAQGGYVPLKKVYQHHPVPDTLTSQQAKYVKGVEGTLWTEYIPSARKAEYMAYPRALALAEMGWSAKKERQWDDFWKRLQPQFKRLSVLNVNYATQYKGKKPHLKTKK